MNYIADVVFLPGTHHPHHCFQTGFLRSGINGTSQWFEETRRVARKEDVTSVRFDTRSGSVIKSKGWKRPNRSRVSSTQSPITPVI